MSSIADREISVTRVFDAPRELVWKVWTEPNHIALWWGPNGFTNSVESMDVSVGGKWKYIMHGPDGVDWPNLITYLEVKKPELLAYMHGDFDQPDQFRVTVKFESVGEKTKIHMQMVFKTAEERNAVVEKHGAVEGLNQNMDKLAMYLSKVKA